MVPTAERRTYADVHADVGPNIDYRIAPFVSPLAYNERPLISVPEFANWMAGENEARWHQIETGGPRPLAYCGHRLKGPVHRRIIEVLPRYQDHRNVGGGCLNAMIDIKQSRNAKKAPDGPYLSRAIKDFYRTHNKPMNEGFDA